MEDTNNKQQDKIYIATSYWQFNSTVFYNKPTQSPAEAEFDLIFTGLIKLKFKTKHPTLVSRLARIQSATSLVLSSLSKIFPKMITIK